MTKRWGDLEQLLSLTSAHALEFLRSLPERPVFPRASFDEIRAMFDLPLADDGAAPTEVIRMLAEAGEKSAIASPSPRFFGYVIGGTLPTAIAADWLTTVWDQNAGLWTATPLASAVEEVVERWIVELLGLPPKASVGFVTGCQMANFTGLAAARRHVLSKAGWDVETDGLAGSPPIRIVCSAESHVTIHGAVKMLGIGSSAVVKVESDDQGRMIAAALRETLADMTGPIIVCAQAGNVNTGAFDPLDEITDAAHEKGAWVHVDGAFGLWVAVSKKRCHFLKGVEKADSWATDAHKWLNVPYDSGIVIVAHPEDHFGSMSLKADYLEKGSDREPLDWVPEFSRRARAIPIWAVLQHLGRNGLEAMIDRGCDMAERAAETLGAVDGIEVVTDVVSNQALFRFHGGDPANDDALTKDVVKRVQDDRVCWLSGTRWHGMEAMRFSVSNWATTAEDIDVTVASIVRCFEAARERQ